MDNQDYYDQFAKHYEVQRGHGYHQMLDDLEIDLIDYYGRNKIILEAGCGTGLLLQQVQTFAKKAHGFDLSPNMLALAQKRNLTVTQGSITNIPFPDNTFDVVYSFKVLAHIDDIQKALNEMARVTKPDGYILAEFYNPHSLRYLVKKIKRPSMIAKQVTDVDVLTHYHSIKQIKKLLPQNLVLERIRGIRIVTIFAIIHKIPIIRIVVRFLENSLKDVPFFRNYGGFTIAVLKKKQ